MLHIFSLIHVLNSLLAAQSVTSIESLPRIAVVTLQQHLEHVQGIDVDDTHLWVSSVDRATKKGWLRRFELATGRLLNTVEVTQENRYHPGGIALDGDSIWVPVAEYKASSSTNIQRRHKTTLRLLGSFVVNDHIGCIAPLGGQLIGGNWDSLLLYRWTANGRELARVPNKTGVGFQDFKPMPGKRGKFIGGGIVAKQSGAVAVFDPRSGDAVKIWPAGKTDRGIHFTNEGLAMRKGRLYLLPEDGDSRLFVFDAGNKLGNFVMRR